MPIYKRIYIPLAINSRPKAAETIKINELELKNPRIVSQEPGTKSKEHRGTTTKRTQAISLLLPCVRQLFAPIVYGSFPIRVSCFSLHVKRYKHGTSFMSIKQVLKPTVSAN